MEDICRYELRYEFPTNLQNFMQKDLTEVKIFRKVLGTTFLKHPVYTVFIKRIKYILYRPAISCIF